MSDGHGFSEEFLRRCESSVDEDLLKELFELSEQRRSELATLLIERKARRAGKNGDSAI